MASRDGPLPGTPREWPALAYFSLVSISEATCLTPGMS